MWFNSTQREKPYQALTSPAKPRRRDGGHRGDRWCMVVVSSCREMLGQVPQRAQPPPPVASIWLGTLEGLPATSRRRVGMTSNHHAPHGLGHTRTTMAATASCDRATGSESLKGGLGSDWSLQPGSMKLESLAIADQHAAVNTFSGLVHTARHTMRAGNARSRRPCPEGGEPSKAGPAIGVKS